MPFGERYFLFSDSLQLVGMVVIGGIGRLVGPILGALWVIGLPAFCPDNDLVPLFTSSIGLLLILMYFPGGFAQIGYRVRERGRSTGPCDVDCRPTPAGGPRPAVAARR